MTSRLQSTIGAIGAIVFGTMLATASITLMAVLDKAPEPTACVLTKADMAPFRFPRTRFPLPVVYVPATDEAEAS